MSAGNTPSTPKSGQAKGSKVVIIGRIKSGKVVPIVSGAYLNELALGSYDAWVQDFATYIQYQMSRKADQQLSLAWLAQYASVNWVGDGQSTATYDELYPKEKYVERLKAFLTLKAQNDPLVTEGKRKEVADQENDLTVSGMARLFGYPTLKSKAENPLLSLALLPLPVYLTTGFHDFLELALEEAGKEPRAGLCRWKHDLDSESWVFKRNRETGEYEPEDEAFVPTKQKPLVYHLYGFDKPETLVLTEDDYLDFLTNIAEVRGRIAPRVDQALTESCLVVLGYRLRDWEFRVLFRGVIKPRPQTTARIAIQAEKDGLEMEYLQKYLRQARFDVEWQSPRDYIEELYQGWGG